MTIKHYAFMAIPILFFVAFGIEGVGMWWERRVKRALRK